MADDPAALARAEALVRSINAGATLHHTTRSAIDLALLLGRGFYSGGGADVPAFAASEASCSDCHAHGHCDVHNLDVQTINVVVDGRVDEERLRRLVEGLLWDGAVPGDAASSRRATVFRIKGMLTLAAGATQPPSRCMLQVCMVQQCVQLSAHNCLHITQHSTMHNNRVCMSCTSSTMGPHGSKGRINGPAC